MKALKNFLALRRPPIVFAAAATLFMAVLSVQPGSWVVPTYAATGTGAPTPINVLILSTFCSSATWPQDVKNKLVAGGMSGTIDIINSGTPSLATLQQYNAILTGTDCGTLGLTIGNLLADYVDGGGGVVRTVFANGSIPIGGRYDTGSYGAWAPTGCQTQGTTQTLGTVYAPSHPIMAGVTSFNGGTSSYRSCGTFTFAAGALRVADWSDGRPLIATNEFSGHRTVDLGFYPPSRDVRSDFWVPTTDGGRIMANALNWVAGGAPVTPTKLVIAQISPTSPRVPPDTFSVTVQSQNGDGIIGNVSQNTSVSLSVTTGTGTLGGTTTGVIAAGTHEVVFSGLTYSKAERIVVLTATRTSGDDLAAGASSSFIVAGQPTVLAKASGDAQIGLPGAVLPQPLVAVVTSNDGSVVPGVNVAFALSSPTGATGQSLSASAATTDTSGAAKVTLTLGNIAGTYNVTATCSACATTNTVIFTAAITAPEKIIAVSGDGQLGAESTTLRRPIVVAVQDSSGLPLPGVTVTFAADKGTLSSTSAVTNATGQASTSLTLGTAGLHTVTATCSACVTTKTVTITATAVKVLPLKGRVVGVDILGTPLSPAGIPSALVTLTQDQFGLTFSTTTDATGAFTVNMAAGDGLLTTFAAGFDPLTELVAVMGTDGVQSPTQANLVASMVQAAKTISGTVRQANLTAIAGALVSAVEVDATTGAAVSGGRVVHELASTLGAYTLRVPASTAWKVAAFTESFGRRDLDLDNNNVADIVVVACSPLSTATCDVSGNPIARNITYPSVATLTGTVTLDGDAVLGASVSGTGLAPAPNMGTTITNALGAYTFSLAIPPTSTVHTYIVYAQTAAAGDLGPRLIKVNSAGLCLNASDVVIPCVLNFAAFTNTITVNFQNSFGTPVTVGETLMTAAASTTLGGQTFNTPVNAVTTSGGTNVSLRVMGSDSEAGVTSVSYRVRVSVVGFGALLNTTVTVPANQTVTATVPVPTVINGTVQQQTADGGILPATGATVLAVASTFTASVTTSSTGAYTITVPSGVSQVVLNVTKSGFGFATQTLTLAGNISGVNFTLTPVLGNVSGVVSGPPVNAPVTVVLKSSNGTTVTVARGATGPNCGVAQVPTPTAWCAAAGPGTYTVTAFADGYKTLNVTMNPVVVAQGSSITVNISMTPIPVQPPTSGQCLDTRRCRVEANISGGKVTVVIPANAAGSTGNPISVTVKPTTDAPETASFQPALIDANGNRFALDIVVLNSTGDRIRTFASPITIRIEGPASQGLVGSFDLSSGDWSGVTFTREGNSVTFNTTHLTKFTVVSVVQSVSSTTIGGPGGGGGSETPTPPPVPLPPFQPVTLITQTVDLSVGGRVSSGPIAVEVPPQAAKGVASITLSIERPTKPFTYPDWAYRGSVVAEIVLKDATGTVITTLDKPMKLTFSYTDDDLTLADGDPKSLFIARMNKDTGTWEQLAVTVDTTAKTLTTEITHLSVFSLLSIPAPAIVGPAEATVSYDFAPLLSWTNPQGATQYQIQVIPFNGDGPGINLIRNAETSYQIQAPKMGEGNYVILPDITYVWRVRTSLASVALGENDPGWSAWASHTFHTAPATSYFITPVGPSPGATVASVTPTLQWANLNKQVFYYEVQVSKDPSFNTDPSTASAMVYWELRHGGVTQPFNSYKIPAQFPLEPSTTYYWRVRPRVQGDGTPTGWSDPWSFITPEG